MSEVSNHKVVAIHGFCGHRLMMLPLCHRLRSMGYQVQNWGYRSLWKSIARHAEHFQRALERIEREDHVTKFHVVAHSMGSIVLRVALQNYQPEKLHRIVMVAPPNRGSHVAGDLAPAFGWLSTTLTEISDQPNSFVNRIECPIDARYEVGIVRAQTDFVVHHESSQLAEAKEYIQLQGFHSSVVVRRNTAEHIRHFFQTGTFDLPEAAHDVGRLSE